MLEFLAGDLELEWLVHGVRIQSQPYELIDTYLQQLRTRPRTPTKVVNRESRNLEASDNNKELFSYILGLNVFT